MFCSSRLCKIFSFIFSCFVLVILFLISAAYSVQMRFSQYCRANKVICSTTNATNGHEDGFSLLSNGVPVSFSYVCYLGVGI